jgi:CBS domain-containing protein
MKISELLRKKFLSFEFDDKLPFAAKKLAQAGVSEAPVTQNMKYFGMFSTSDIARVLVKISVFGKLQAPDFEKAKNDPLLMHMHQFTATLGPDSDIISAYLVLLHKNVDVIPVVDKRNTLVGVVLASDLREKMAQMLSEKGKVPSRQIIAPSNNSAPPKSNAPQMTAAPLNGAEPPKGNAKPGGWLGMFHSNKSAIKGAPQGAKPAVPASPPSKAQLPVVLDEKLGNGSTALDMVLHYVQVKGAATAEEVAARFKIPEAEIEEFAISLEKHGLLKVEFNFMGKMTLKKME